uniref:Uncharacterized protein n=1 Tax=Anopheles melas TaxID=34690 RepID=A0A182UDS8_9DIPT
MATETNAFRNHPCTHNYAKMNVHRYDYGAAFHGPVQRPVKYSQLLVNRFASIPNKNGPKNQSCTLMQQTRGYEVVGRKGDVEGCTLPPRPLLCPNRSGADAIVRIRNLSEELRTSHRGAQQQQNVPDTPGTVRG